MKKNRFNALIAGGVAAAGVLASVGTAFALYYKAPNDKNIDISITTSSDVSLAINNLARVGTEEFTPDNKTLGYTYNLSGSKLENSSYTQNVVTGYLTVKVEATGETDILDNIIVTNKVEYAGSYYNADKQSKITLAKDEDGGYLVGSKITPVLISGNNAALTITLGNNVTDEMFAEYDGVEIKTTISFVSLTDKVATANNWVVPHVMGGIDGWGWAENDAGAMVPNLGADKYEWMWVADQNYGESQFKVKQGNTWYAEKGNTGSEDNMKRTIVTGDTIYFHNGALGNDGEYIYFSHPQA